MTKKGSELEFISQINRDGKGVIDVTNLPAENLNDVTFTLTRLSMTYGTYIASDFNSYVVKIKAK